MDRQFPGSYRPSARDKEEMLREAIIAFDANVLLHAYRYTPVAREQLLDAMERVRERNQLWLPYQAVTEFHRNREDTIAEQHTKLDAYTAAFKHVMTALGGDAPPKRAPLDLDRLRKIAAGAETRARRIVDEARGQLTVSNDAILARLTTIIGERYGDEPDEKWQVAQNEIARERYARRVPPGYADEKKDESERYGDYLLWRQLLDHAKEAEPRRPIILVTDDQKGDWWLVRNGRTIGPRQELLTEMAREAGVRFHLYTADQFLTFAQRKLGVTRNDEVIAEAREVAQEAEAESQAIAAGILVNADPSHLRSWVTERIPGIAAGAAAAFDGIRGQYVTEHPSLAHTLTSRALNQAAEASAALAFKQAAGASATQDFQHAVSGMTDDSIHQFMQRLTGVDQAALQTLKTVTGVDAAAGLAAAAKAAEAVSARGPWDTLPSAALGSLTGQLDQRALGDLNLASQASALGQAIPNAALGAVDRMYVDAARGYGLEDESVDDGEDDDQVKQKDQEEDDTAAADTSDKAKNK